MADGDDEPSVGVHGLNDDGDETLEPGYEEMQQQKRLRAKAVQGKLVP